MFRLYLRKNTKNFSMWGIYLVKVSRKVIFIFKIFHHFLGGGAGVVAIGTLGTQALPNKERNLSIRNQKVFKYWAQYKEISSKFKWIVLNLGHQQLILLSSQYCTWNISNRNQEREKVPSLENASTTPMGGCNLNLTVQNLCSSLVNRV